MRSGIQPLAELDDLLGVAVGPSLTPSGLWTPEKNSTCAPSSSRVRSPIQSMCAEQSYQSPVSESRRVSALLVVEQQPLVARPDVDLVELRRRREVDPARGHERERALDLGGERLVALALRRARDEVLVPGVHLGQVGEAALRERAHEVERRGRRGGSPASIRSGSGTRASAVGASSWIMWPRKTGISPSGGLLDRRRARLHELPGDAADLQHRQRGAVGEHGRHLQQDLQPLADRDRRVGGAGLGQRGEVVERLGAVAGLEQERAAGRDLGERGAHLPRLAGEDERRQRVQALAGRSATRASSGHSGCWSASRSRHEDGDQVESTHGHVRQCRRGGTTAKLASHAHLLRHPAHGREALRQLLGRLPPVRGDAGAGARGGGEAFFCIVDLHSITVDYDPADLRERSLDLAALLFATGLDPERSTVFAQSHVTAHAEAAWLLSAVTSYGQLGRMTQFKEKGDRQEFVTAGLFTYPILMAGDILLYQTDLRPDRRRPAAAPRARARRRRAVQHALRRRRSRCPDGDLPGDRRADHGPAGADEEDVDDRRHAAGHGADARPARRDPQEGQERGHRLGQRGAPRRRQGRA